MKRNLFILTALLSLIGCSTKYENEIEFISDPPEAAVYFVSNPGVGVTEFEGTTPFTTNKIPNRTRYVQFRKAGYLDSELIPFSQEDLKRQDVQIAMELQQKTYISDTLSAEHFELTEQGLRQVSADHITQSKSDKKLGAGAIIGIVILGIIVLILVIVFWDFVITLLSFAANMFYLILTFIFYLMFVTIPNKDRNKVILELSTTPVEASIYIGNHPDSLELFEYGVTPVKVKSDRGSIPRLVQFSKEGYGNSDIFHIPVSLKDRNTYNLNVVLEPGISEKDVKGLAQTAKNTLEVTPFRYADNISVQLNPEKSLYATPDYRRGRNVVVALLIFISIVIFIVALIYLANDKPAVLIIGVLIYAGMIFFRVKLQKKIYAHTYYTEKILVESEPSDALLYHGNLSNSMSVFTVPESTELKAKNLVQSEFFQFKKPGYGSSKVIRFPKEKADGYFVIQAKIEPEQ